METVPQSEPGGYWIARSSSTVFTHLWDARSSGPAPSRRVRGEGRGEGRFRESEPPRFPTDAQTRETAPSPVSLRDPTSSRTRGEVISAALQMCESRRVKPGDDSVFFRGADIFARCARIGLSPRRWSSLHRTSSHCRCSTGSGQVKVARPRLKPNIGWASAAIAAAGPVASSTTMSAGAPTAMP